MSKSAPYLLFLLSVCAWATVSPAATVSIVPGAKGLAVKAGGALEFELEYPRLLAQDASKDAHKIIEVIPGKDTATLKYEGGAGAVLSVHPDGTVDIVFSNVPADVKNYGCMSYINFNFSSSGGKWRMGSQPEQPFPVEKLAKPHFYQGHAGAFSIYGADGKGLTFTMTRTPYVELTDNREWGWKIFVWKFFSPFDHGQLTDHLKIVATELSAAPGQPTPSLVQVDRFGQSVRSDWPDKVKSEADLTADVEADKAYYAGFNPPAADRFGGLPGSGEKLGLKETGFFQAQKAGDRWTLVDPEGNAFFHLAAGCFTTPSWTYVTGRKQIYEWVPPNEGEFGTAYMHPKNPNDFSFYNANLIRKYGKPVDKNEVNLRMVERVRRLGFNSAGPFTDAAPAFQQTGFPYVLGLPGGFPAIPGMERVDDPFAEGAAEKLDANFAASVAPRANDPLLIGYFFGNEPIYEDIPRVIPTLKGKQAAKRRLVQMLTEKYGSIERFNQAWNAHAAAFEELNDTGLAVTTPAASADMQAYTAVFLERLFQLVETTFRKYDKNHLLIGYRLQYGTINNEQLCRLMGKYVDVVSFNYYANGVDADFLKKVYKWTGGKPMILSEFYWSSPPDSGLSGGVKDVDSQTTRGLAYRNYLEQSAALGFVVGTEWFTLIDQSVTGNWFSKYNGENGNTGLFAVTDRPWKKAVAEMAKSNYGIYEVALNNRPAFAYDNPLFKAAKGGARTLKMGRATGPIRLDGSATNWPGLPAEELGGRVVQGAGAGGVNASFKACWDDRNFYFLINVTDPTPMLNNNSGDGLWQGDAVELFFGSERTAEAGFPFPSDRHLLLSAGGAGGKPAWHFAGLAAQPACQIGVTPNVDGKGYTLEAIIPFESLGFKPATGNTIRFDVGLDDSVDGKSRSRQLMWNGSEHNSRERSGWGSAAFLQ